MIHLRVTHWLDIAVQAVQIVVDEINILAQQTLIFANINDFTKYFVFGTI